MTTTEFTLEILVILFSGLVVPFSIIGVILMFENDSSIWAKVAGLAWVALAFGILVYSFQRLHL